MRIYKPVSWLVSINAYHWKSACCFLKHIFKMGVNRKFDFRWVWKFCWDLSNVISGGNWLFMWNCVFSGETLYPSANYVVYKMILCDCPWKSFYWDLYNLMSSLMIFSYLLKKSKFITDDMEKICKTFYGI